MLVDADDLAARLELLATAETSIVTSDPSSHISAQDKALARRAQVRRAQIQHRQRKANYTRQLELDIADLRRQIDETEAAAHALRLENDAIRERLIARETSLTSIHIKTSPVLSTTPDPRPSPFVPQPDMTIPSRPLAVPEYTVTMGMNHLMGTPAFQVLRSHDERPRARTSTTQVVGGLTPEQTDLVVNFILALEHICWDHFDHSYYHSTDPDGREHGHALMASSLALQHAPARVFSRIEAVQSALHTNPQSSPHTSDISWRSSALTLDSLFGLAQMLSPPDVELAPVQAWFEIVRDYGPDVGLDPRLLEQLKRELCGVIKCLHFGAVIERDAFNSVVSRVVSERHLELPAPIGYSQSLSELPAA